MRDREYCKSDWRRRLGSGFGLVAGFLEMLPGTVAETYPNRQSGLPLIPRRVHDDTYTARPDDPDVTRGAAVRGIAAADVARWRVRWDLIGEAVAAAFLFEAHAGQGPFQTPWVRSIGVLRANDSVLPVLLLMAKSEGEALGWVQHLVRGEPRVIILPFHDQFCADLATAQGHRYLALDRDMHFVVSKGRWQAHDPRTGYHLASGKDAHARGPAGEIATAVIEQAVQKGTEKALAQHVESYKDAVLICTPSHKRQWWQNVRAAYVRQPGPLETDKWRAVAKLVVSGAIEENKKPVKERHSDYVTPLMLGRLIATLNAPRASRQQVEAHYAAYLRRRVPERERNASLT